MSEAKYAAAKEFIEEKNYDTARKILQSIDEPKAGRWLERLDEIAPPRRERRQKQPTTQTAAISSEAEEFYRESNRGRKNRKRNRIADNEARGLQVSLGSILVLGLWLYYDYFEPAQRGISRPFEFSQGSLLIIGFCLLLFIGGLVIFFNARGQRKNIR